MSKLTDFYIHKASLQEGGKPIDPQWDQLEDQLLKEELLPELVEQLRTVLSKVKSPLMFCGSYDPNGCLSVSFTRNCLQISTFSPMQTAHHEEQMGVEAEDESDDTFIAEPEETTQEEAIAPEVKNARAKSIGFAVSFRDGTVYHEKKAVNTWILALQKIGLETICNNRSKHSAWHRVNGQDICIVERTRTIREDGNSPQTQVDGFYVMTQLSNEQKEKDLLTLGKFMPKLGIQVTWDEAMDEVSDDTTRKPIINEDAALWKYPIKEQFRDFLEKKKSAGTAKSYTSTLDNAVRQWINKLIDEQADSVFSYTTSEDVRRCIEILQDSQAYMQENDRKHHAMSAALNQYLLFIKELEEWKKQLND